MGILVIDLLDFYSEYTRVPLFQFYRIGNQDREPRFPYDPSFIGTPGCVNLASHLFSQESLSINPRSLIEYFCIGSLEEVLGIGNQAYFIGTLGERSEQSPGPMQTVDQEVQY